MLRRNQGGLSSLSDEQLKAILKRVYSGELPCPFGRSDLLMRGLNAVAEEGELLFGLEESGVRAVLSAVFAERRATAQALLRMQTERSRASES